MGFDVKALAIGCSTIDVTESFVLSNARCNSTSFRPSEEAGPEKSALTNTVKLCPTAVVVDGGFTTRLTGNTPQSADVTFRVWSEPEAEHSFASLMPVKLKEYSLGENITSTQ